MNATPPPRTAPLPIFPFLHPPHALGAPKHSLIYPSIRLVASDCSAFSTPQTQQRLSQHIAYLPRLRTIKGVAPHRTQGLNYHPIYSCVVSPPFPYPIYAKICTPWHSSIFIIKHQALQRSSPGPKWEIRVTSSPSLSSLRVDHPSRPINNVEMNSALSFLS